LNDLYSELIGFGIVTIVVIMLAFFSFKLEEKFKDKNNED